MKNSIATSLLLLALLFCCTSCGSNGYEKKHGQIYFRAFSGGDWTMRSVLVDSADAATFTTIDTKFSFCLGKDKDHVFLDGSILRFADPNTFGQLQEYYWKDKNHVFCLGAYFGGDDYRVHGADPKTFAPMDIYPWSKDANHVYYYDDSLKDVNTNTFTPINEDWGKDRKCYYQQSSKVDSLVYDEAVIVSRYYIKDKKHVFYENKRVKDANPKTFKPDGAGFFGHDGKYMFDREKNTGPITEDYRNTYINQK